jgi:hypothetical protein
MTDLSRTFPTFHAARRIWARLWRCTRPLRTLVFFRLLPLLLLLFLGVHLVVNARASRALETELLRIRAQGEPLSLGEIAPPPVPDDRNAALVYNQAFERLPALEPPPRDKPQEPPRFNRGRERAITLFLSEKPRKREASAPPGAAESGPPGYFRSGEPVSLAQVRQALEGTAEALALARRAAAMPDCRFPVDYDAGAGALFPHLPKLRTLSGLLAADAVAAANDGQNDRMVADLEAVLGIAHHMGQEPILISQLVQYASVRQACLALQRALETAALNQQQSHRLVRALDLDLYSSFERSMQGERCFGLWGFDMAQHDLGRLLKMVGVADDAPQALVGALRSLGAPWLKLDEVYYLRYMTERVDQAKLRAVASLSDPARDDPQVPVYAIISRIMLPVFSQAAFRRDEALSRLAMARVALAVEASRRQSGAAPASLAEAASAVDWPLPQDPYSGREFRYRRTADGYLLYSVGPNRKDDDGQDGKDYKHRARELMRPATAPPPPTLDDIVWPSGA